MVRSISLMMHQSPGDGMMLTAAIRDLHLAHPGRFQTDIRTSCNALWENSPYITHMNDSAPGVESIQMHYPLVHESDRAAKHFIHAYPQFLEERLNVRIPITKFHGDIHLSTAEKTSPPIPGIDLPEHFWIIVAGGKYDFTAKWWDPANFQKVVDYFAGKIQFVQVGEAGHWHLATSWGNPLSGEDQPAPVCPLDALCRRSCLSGDIRHASGRSRGNAPGAT